MKKIITSVLVFTLSTSLFLNTADAAKIGSKENPFSAYDENTIMYQPTASSAKNYIKIQLLDMSADSSTNDIIKQAYILNPKPYDNYTWFLLKFKFSYLSSSANEKIRLSHLLQLHMIYDSNFREIEPDEQAKFITLYQDKDLSQLSIDPGSITEAYSGLLLDKTKIPYPYLHIFSMERNYWFSTDPNYKPTIDKNDYDFSKIPLTVKTNDNVLTYTGNALKPDVTVSNDGTDLIKDKDYTITYSENTNVGYGSYTLKGIGDYNGSKSYNFTIKPNSTEIKSIKNSKSKSVTLSWNSVKGAKYYNVYYTSGSKPKTLKVNGTSTTVKKLNKNVSYKFYVVANYDSKVFSDNSKTKTIKVKK